MKNGGTDARPVTAERERSGGMLTRPAGDGEEARAFRQATLTLDAAAQCARHRDGDVGEARVVVVLDDDLAVRAEVGLARVDLLLCQSRCGENTGYGKKEQAPPGHACQPFHEEAFDTSR